MPAAPDSDGSPLPLCPSCGVIRAVHESACPHCHVPYPTNALTHARPDSDYWACLECTFQCRSCGFRVPLNHLDIANGVLCARCGLAQAFEAPLFGEALRHAHAVTEMHHLQTPGRDDAIARIGDHHTTATRRFGGPGELEMSASPGYPLCRTCHTPLDVTTRTKTLSLANGEAMAACATCKTETKYQVPAAALAMTEGALQAAITAEPTSALDRAAVTAKQGAGRGVTALACPSCSAPLEVSSTSKLLTCAYCKTVSRITEHTLFQVSGKEPAIEPIWVLFRGSSAERKSVDEKMRKKAHDAAEEAERRRKRDEERLHKPDPSTTSHLFAEPGTYASPKIESARVPVYPLAGLIGGLVIAAGVGGYAYVSTRMSHGGPGAAPSADASAYADAEASGVSVSSLSTPRAPSVAIPSCRCSSKSAAGRDDFQLMAPLAAFKWSFAWTHAAGAVETVLSVPIDPSVTSPALPPQVNSDTLRLGMACDGPLIAVIHDNRVSAWSGKAVGALWTTTLPEMYIPVTPDTSSPSTNLDVACGAPIPVERGMMTVGLRGGKRVKISLADGTVR